MPDNRTYPQKNGGNVQNTPRQLSSVPRQLSSVPRQSSSVPRQSSSVPRQSSSVPRQSVQYRSTAQYRQSATQYRPPTAGNSGSTQPYRQQTGTAKPPRTPNRRKRKLRGGCLLPIIVLIVAAAMTAGIFYPKIIRKAEEKAYPIAYEEIIMRYAAENGLEPALVFAVVHTESRFRPDAVSSADAKGLMQLTDDTNEWVAFLQHEDAMPERIFEPEMNVRRGCRLLAYLIGHYGNTETALAAYNAGIGRVNSWLTDSAISSDGVTLQNIPFAETRAYVSAVTRTAAIYRRLYFDTAVQ